MYLSAYNVNRRRLLRDAGGLAALLTTPSLLAAGGGASSALAATGSQTFRIGHVTGIDTMNPMISQTGYWTFVPIYPYLFDQVSATKPLTPSFATSWRRSADGLSYTLKVQSGQKWSDGVPLTSRDVAFTVNMLVKYALPTALLNLFTPGLAGAENQRVCGGAGPPRTLLEQIRSRKRICARDSPNYNGRRLGRSLPASSVHFEPSGASYPKPWLLGPPAARGGNRLRTIHR